MLIVAGILATFPQMFAELIQQLITAEETKNILVFVITMLMFIAVIVFIVFMEAAQRKIPIQYANRPAAASFRGRSDSNIPIKLNSASVIPVIFASTLMSLPATIIQITQVNTTSGIGKWLSQIFLTTSTDATTGNVTINVMGFLLYIILIVVFSFFYSFLQLNPEKMSENLQKQNAYVPGVRPGEETTGYISRVLFKMTVVGATYLTIVAILPIVMTVIFDLPASAQIGGTSLIIVVGVAIESWKQLKQAKQEKQYRGFID
jgi:preprotein translocase subunit SecY